MSRQFALACSETARISNDFIVHCTRQLANDSPYSVSRYGYSGKDTRRLLGASQEPPHLTYELTEFRAEQSTEMSEYII